MQQGSLDVPIFFNLAETLLKRRAAIPIRMSANGSSTGHFTGRGTALLKGLSKREALVVPTGRGVSHKHEISSPLSHCFISPTMLVSGHSPICTEEELKILLTPKQEEPDMHLLQSSQSGLSEFVIMDKRNRAFYLGPTKAPTVGNPFTIDLNSAYKYKKNELTSANRAMGKLRSSPKRREFISEETGIELITVKEAIETLRTQPEQKKPVPVVPVEIEEDNAVKSESTPNRFSAFFEAPPSPLQPAPVISGEISLTSFEEAEAALQKAESGVLEARGLLVEAETEYKTALTVYQSVCRRLFLEQHNLIQRIATDAAKASADEATRAIERLLQSFSDRNSLPIQEEQPTEAAVS